MKREINRESGSTRLDVLAAVIVIAVIVTTSLAALVPAMNKAREAAMRARCAAQLKEIGAAISMYADAYDGFLPWYGGYDPNFPPPFTGTAKDELHPYVVYRCNHSNNDLTYQDSSKTCVCGANGKPIPMKLACLFEEGLINDGRVFYCPANLNPDYMYDSYINSPWGNTWGTPHQVYNISGGRNDWIRIGYSYYPIDGFFNGLTTPCPPSYAPYIINIYGSNVPKYTARKYVQLSEQYPYLTDLIWRRADLSHKTGIDLSTNVPIGAGINALFKDGHVVYVKDQPVKVRDKTQTFFNNDYWTNWDRPASMPPSEGDNDARYILFNLYKLIQIQP